MKKKEKEITYSRINVRSYEILNRSMEVICRETGLFSEGSHSTAEQRHLQYSKLDKSLQQYGWNVLSHPSYSSDLPLSEPLLWKIDSRKDVFSNARLLTFQVMG